MKDNNQPTWWEWALLIILGLPICLVGLIVVVLASIWLGGVTFIQYFFTKYGQIDNKCP